MDRADYEALISELNSQTTNALSEWWKREIPETDKHAPAQVPSTNDKNTEGVKGDAPDKWQYDQILYARKTSATRTGANPPSSKECWEYLIQ